MRAPNEGSCCGGCDAALCYHKYSVVSTLATYGSPECWLTFTGLIGNKSADTHWHSACSLGWQFSMLKYKYIFKVKYRPTEAILSNSTRKLLWFEITKMLTAVKKINLLYYYNFRHTSHGVVPYVVYILRPNDQLTQRIDLTSSVTCRRHDPYCGGVNLLRNQSKLFDFSDVKLSLFQWLT